MKINHFIIALALPAMAGCSQNEITDQSPEANRPMGFSVYTDAQTRAPVIDNALLQKSGFKVFAFKTGAASWTGTTETANVMYDQKVTYSGGAWTYSPLRYWPDDPSEKITFFAYAGNGGTNPTVTVSEAGGEPELLYSINDKNGMTDIVIDESQKDKTSAGGTVAFKFKHITSRINLVAKVLSPLSGGSYIVISSLKIQAKDKNAQSQFYKSGTYGVNLLGGSGKWVSRNNLTPGDFDITPLLSGAPVGKGTTDECKILKDGEYLYPVPTKTGLLSDGGIKLDIGYSIATPDASNPGKVITASSATKTVSLPAGELKQGKAYKYTLIFDAPDKISISPQTVEEWGADTDITLPPPLYNGKTPNLLAIRGKTAYWVAPEDANANIAWDNNLDRLCPPGWHVPTKDEFVAMTGLPADENWYDDNYDAIAAAFPADNLYWSSTEFDPYNAWGLMVYPNSSSSAKVTGSAMTNTTPVRCVRKVGE